MQKQEILNHLETSREQFLDLLEGLPDEAYLKPGVVGEWSIKDILAHLSRWEAELVKLLWQVKSGQSLNSLHFSKNLNVDEQNATWLKEARSRSLERVLGDFHAVRNQTLLRVESFSEKEIIEPGHFPGLKGKALLDFLSGDSYDHEDEHKAEIKSWLEKQNFMKE